MRLTRQRTSAKRRVRVRKWPRFRRLAFEPLEGRRLLANVTVSNFLDVINGDTSSIANLIASPGADGICLREAIVAANAAADADVITFDAALSGQTIGLLLGELLVSNDLTITGLGANFLTVDASGNDLTPDSTVGDGNNQNDGDGSRVFNVSDADFTPNKVVSISGLTLLGSDSNSQLGGGAVFNREQLTISNLVIRDNSAGGPGNFFEDSGGGVSTWNARLTIVDSTITANSAAGRGGGVFSYASELVIRNSTISGNTALAGGGIYTLVDAGPQVTTVEASTISGNFAIGGSGGGGGIRAAAGSLTITNSTISGNMTNAEGGGVFQSFGTIAVQNSTIALNQGGSSSSFGGGVYLQSTNTTIDGSIIAGNFAQSSARSDLFEGAGQGPSVRYSLIGVNSGSGLQPAPIGSPDPNGNLIGSATTPIDPLLTGLANNGGPTLTHALLTGSPAINAGDPGFQSPPQFDQRGDSFVRVFGTRIDIGALEAQPTIELIMPPTQSPREGLSFDLSAFTTFLDNGTGPYSATVNWGDGSPPQFPAASGGRIFANHIYRDNGLYTIQIQLSNGIDSDSDGFNVIVENVLPNLSVVGNQTIVAGNTLTISDLGTISDPGFSNPAPPPLSFEVFRYFIDWGDGPPADSDFATINTPGGNNKSTEASFDGSHIYAVAGTFTVTVRVADDDMSGNFVSGVAGVDYIERTFLVEVEPAGPQTFVVDTLVDEDDDNFAPGDLSLREAIRLANQNVGQADTITFAPALTAGGPATIELSLGALLIRDAVTITGPAANLLTVDARGNDPTPDSTLEDSDGANDGDGTRVFDIDDDDSETTLVVTISGLTITGGDSNSSGGGIRNRENLTLTASVVTGNMADSGGGIGNYEQLAVVASTVSANQSQNSGGGISNLGVASSDHLVRVTNSTVSGNLARFFGGGVYTLNGQAIVEGTTVANNRVESPADGNGGGGLATLGGALTLSGSLVTSNSTAADGLTAVGGGILNQFGTLNVLYSAVSGNQPIGRGGGIFNRGDLTIDGSTVSGNRAAGADAGGIYHGEGNLSVLNSTISGNGATTNGGGFVLATQFSPSIGIRHSTITNNMAALNAASVGFGGGVYVTGQRPLEFRHVIVAGNFDNSNAAPDLFVSDPGQLQVSFSLIGNNTGNDLVEAPVGVPDANSNLIGDPDSKGVINALLGPLANNGSPTETHALLPGSAAINAGNPGFQFPPTVDQRGTGFPRVAYGRIDIGAYEYGDPIPTNFVVDIATDELDGNFAPGDLSLREALWASNFDPEVRTITFAPNLNGATILLTMGELTVSDSVTIDASSLGNGVTVDASGNDPTPDSTLSDGDFQNDFDGSRVIEINDDTSGPGINVSISGLTFTGGDSNDRGGGILNREDLTLVDCIITDNVAIGGGGISNFGRVEMSGSTVSSNEARVGGGGIANALAYFRIVESTITGNTAQASGGGAYNNYGEMIVEGSTVSNNRAVIPGSGAGAGGVASSVYTPTSTETGSHLEGNVAGGSISVSSGGGIFSPRGTLTVDASTIRGNRADYGGGISGSESVIVRNSTFSGNASVSGGGVHFSDGTLEVVNSTLSGNTADHNGGGMALFLEADSSTASIRHSTIARNTSDFNEDFDSSGGGIYARGIGQLALEHTIIAGNIDNSDVAPDLDLTTGQFFGVSLLYSLIGSNRGSGLTEAPVGLPNEDGNLIGGPTGGVIDPRLDPLADNGGPTLTHRLQSNSPAIDTGIVSAVAGAGGVPLADQRGTGFARISGGRIDMGALEFVNSPPVLQNVLGPQTSSEGGLFFATALATFNDDDAFDNHTFSVDWGDGSPVDVAAVEPSVFRFLGGGHSYADNGEYAITLTIMDNHGGSDTATISMTVANVDPTLTGTNGLSVDEGQAFTLDDLGVILQDPGYDTETFVNVTIDWGDNTAAVPYTIVNLVNGASLTPTTAQFNHAPHAYADNGTYTVTIMVQDDDGEAVQRQFEIEVLNVAPTLTLLGPADAAEGSAYTLTLMSSDPGADTITSWTINWGDGEPELFNGNPATVTHVYADGVANFVISATATDEDGTYSAGNTVDVRVVNVAPSLTLSGPESVDEGAVYTLSLFSGDPAPDTLTSWTINWGDGETQVVTGDPTSVTHVYADGVANFNISATAIDEDGTYEAANTVSVAVRNVAPTLTLSGSEDVLEGSTYTLALSSSDPGADTITSWIINWGDGPPELFTGDPPSVTHVYTDGNANLVISATATDEDGTHSAGNTMSVAVRDVAPTLRIIGPAEVTEGVTYTLTLASTDPGADTITRWTINWGDGLPEQVTGDPISVTHVYADGEANFVISATATDEDGTYSVGNTVSVAVRNVAPTLTLSGPASVDEGAVYTLALLAADPGADTITSWTINWGDDDSQLVAGNPTSVTHVYADGGANFVVSATATDEDGTYSDGNTVSVTVLNVVPTVSVASTQSLDTGEMLSLVDLLVITDPGFGSEAFDVYLDWGDGTIVRGEATIDEVGGILTLTRASFDGEHVYAAAGTYEVTVRVADDDMSGDFEMEGNEFNFVQSGFVVLVDAIIIPPEPPPVEPEPPPVAVEREIDPVRDLPSLLLTIPPALPTRFVESDGGGGGGEPQPLPFEVPPGARAILDERVIQAAYYRPNIVRREEVVDAVFTLGDIELVSLVGVDMGDDPMLGRRRKPAAVNTDVPVAEPPAVPIIADVQVPEVPAEPSWNSLAFWAALAGSGTLWAGGTWWWMRRGRRMSRG